MGDYFTNQHLAQYYIYMRPYILHKDNILNFLQGCVKLSHPHLHMHTYTQTLQMTLRNTQTINVQRH